MQVTVNIINTRCTLMSQAITVPSLIIMTLIVSEESLARDRHTDRQTHIHTNTGLVSIKIFQVDYDFENKKKKNHTCTSMVLGNTVEGAGNQSH